MIEVLGNQIMGTVNLTYAGPIGSDVKFKTPKTWKLQAGDYTVWLGADPPLPYQYNDPDRTNNQVSKSFTVFPLSTDWELSNPFTVPANPKAGDSVVFGATLRALSTDGPFPQTVQIEVLGSGIIDSFSVAYLGPVGSSMTIMSTKTWNLQASNYKIYLVADSPPPYHYNDSNRTNNQATASITVT